jgi:hypothetical protein
MPTTNAEKQRNAESQRRWAAKNKVALTWPAKRIVAKLRKMDPAKLRQIIESLDREEANAR